MPLYEATNVDASGNSIVKSQLQDNAGSAVVLGQQVAGSSLPVVLTAAEEAQLGAITETAPGTDTASSGLNGRLQRIAQRITSMIALLPTALGQGTMAQSLKVVVASDQSAIPVTVGVSSTATQTSVVSSASSVSILASNASRKGILLYNDSTQIARVFYGATASATAFSILMQPNAFYESAVNYTGAVSAIWAAANGNMRVTELS